MNLCMGLEANFPPLQSPALYPEDGLCHCPPWAGFLAPVGCQAMERARAGFFLSSTWGSKGPVGWSPSLSFGKIVNCG